ncbi:MAG: hypothetical protein IKU25_04900 [Clostridia bacterium]|nr:hypothetical protein [Clostridia bacterium]
MGLFDLLFGKKKQPLPKVSDEAKAEPVGAPAQAVTEMSVEELKVRIAKVFAEKLNDVDVEANVSAGRLCELCGLNANIHPACASVDFIVKQDGKLCLAIVVVRPNTYRGMNVIGTKEICDKAGIPYMRFFTSMPNEEQYIEERIKNAI